MDGYLLKFGSRYGLKSASNPHHRPTGRTDHRGSDTITRPFYYATNSYVPSVLSVSKEAGKVGLEYYTLEFDTDFQDIIGSRRWHRYRCLNGYSDCQCHYRCRAKITTSLEPHISIDLNRNIICPVTLGAPLGYFWRTRMASTMITIP